METSLFMYFKRTGYYYFSVIICIVKFQYIFLGTLGLGYILALDLISVESNFHFFFIYVILV